MGADLTEFNAITTPIDSGLTLLEAGAGTGKTFSLVRIVARQIVELGIPIEKILVVTFTKAATAEISERLQSLLYSYKQEFSSGKIKDKNDLPYTWNKANIESHTIHQRLDLALANFDNAAIYTIDGFFQRVLKENTLETAHLFNAELTTNEDAIIELAIKDYWRSKVYSLTSEDYEKFSESIKLREIKDFIKLTLNNKSAQLHPFYFGMTKNAQESWDKLRHIISTEKTRLIEFIEQAVDGLSKANGTLFHASKKNLYIEQINSIAKADDDFEAYMELLSKLQFSVYQNDKAWTKAKRHLKESFVNHPIATVLQSIEVLSNELPKHYYQTKTYGTIYQYVIQRVNELKKELNQHSYNDITEKIHTALVSKLDSTIRNSLRAKYKAALIDEFQDTSPHQCEVFLKLFKNTQPHEQSYFHIIGDPKQSIYKFRGADVYAYLKAANEADHRYSLLTNYRSSAGLTSGINHLFQQVDDPFKSNGLIKFQAAKHPAHAQLSHSKTPPMQIRSFPQRNYTAIADNICSEIIQLLGKPWSFYNTEKEGSIQASDIAILVRKKKEATLLQKQLNSYNIPCTLQTTSSLLESREAKEMHLLLSSILEPKRRSLLTSVLLTPAMGMGNFIDGKDFNIPQLDELIEVFSQAKQLWQKKNIMPMFLNLCEQLPLRTNLLSCTEGERRMTNFFHLAEVLDTIARDKNLSPLNTVALLESAIQGDTNEIEAETLEQRISTDENAVQIITLHKSKGLEYEIVFLPFINQYLSETPLIYHDPATHDAWIAPPPSTNPTHHDLRLEEECADGIRLYYVGLTRACQRCYLYHYPLLPYLTKAPGTIDLTLPLTDADYFSNLADQSNNTIEFISYSLEDKHKPNNRHQATKAQNQQIDLEYLPSHKLTISQKNRTSSFTGITRNIEEAKDYDNVAGHQNSAPYLNQEKFWDLLRPGAALGLTFHEILELANFQDISDLEQLIPHFFAKHQPYKNPTALTGDLFLEVGQYLKQLYLHDLGDNLRLCDISPQQRLNEAEFLFNTSSFSPPEFSHVLAHNPPEYMPENYLQQLQDTPLKTLQGYLDGIIDLVFVHEGRYHILDWKTNLIEDNSPSYLATKMASSHYFLQYHLYTVALDRFLTQNLIDYDPNKHLGNVYYIFLRGIDIQAPGSGVYRDTISVKRLELLRSIFQ